MNTAAKGRRLEKKTQEYFEAMGFNTMSARASKGVFDVIAWNSKGGFLVQVKASQWPGVVEMEAIEDAPCPPNFTKLVHRWKPFKKYPDVREVE